MLKEILTYIHIQNALEYSIYLKVSAFLYEAIFGMCLHLETVCLCDTCKNNSRGVIKRGAKWCQISTHLAQINMGLVVYLGNFKQFLGHILHF